MTRLLLLYLAACSAYAYLLMWQDKQAAIRQKRRTPERRLFRVAAIGGSLGIWLGTRAPLYHKRAKPAFKRPLLTITIAQIILLCAIAYWRYFR